MNASYQALLVERWTKLQSLGSARLIRLVSRIRAWLDDVSPLEQTIS